MNWGNWLVDTLKADAGVTAIVSQRVHTYLRDVPVRPFIVVTMGPELSAPTFAGVFRFGTVWVHDEPLGYKRIRQAIDAVRSAIAAAESARVGMEPEMIAAEWQGNSGDLFDDGMGTITRNIEYRLTGRNIWQA